jgi:hypothetical protein
MTSGTASSRATFKGVAGGPVERRWLDQIRPHLLAEADRRLARDFGVNDTRGGWGAFGVWRAASPYNAGDG